MKEEKFSKQYWIDKYKILDDEYFNVVAELQKENKRLKEELTIRDEALKLACEEIDSCMDCDKFNCRKEPYNETHNCIECKEYGLREKYLSRYFIEQAKEKHFKS